MPLTRLLRRWLVVLAVGALLGGVASAQPQGRPLRNVSPELQSLLAMPLGARPAEEMHWPQVLDGLGRPADAARLREWLLGRWLRQQAGEALPAPLPLEHVLGARASEVVPTWDRSAQDLWQQVFNRHLLARLPAAAVPVPGEIEVLREQLVESAPGLWLLRDRAGTPRAVYAWVELGVRGPEPFPATGFVLPLAPGAGGSLECSLPRGQVPRLLPAGEVAGVLCARAVGGSAAPTASPSTALPSASAAPAMPSAATLAEAVARAGQAGTLQPDALWREGVRRALADALAAPRRAEGDAWLQQRRAAAEERGAKARAESAARTRDKQRRDDFQRRAILTGVGVATVAVFLLLARRFGPWWAGGVLWVVGMAVCVPLALMMFKAGRDAGGWGAMGAGVAGLLLLATPTWVAVGLPVVYLFVTRMLGDAAFRRDLAMGLLAVTLVLLLQVLLERLL